MWCRTFITPTSPFMRYLASTWQTNTSRFSRHAFADRIVGGERGRFALLKASLEVVRVPESLHRLIIARWKAQGGLSMAEFAEVQELKLSNNPWRISRPFWTRPSSTPLR
jgi:hypothetical protein